MERLDRRPVWGNRLGWHDLGFPHCPSESGFARGRPIWKPLGVGRVLNRFGARLLFVILIRFRFCFLISLKYDV